MMKVLLVHEFYRSSAPSGEDAVYLNEFELLKRNGLDVGVFEKFNDDIDESTLAKRLQLGMDVVWARDSYKALTRKIRIMRPDVVHFHNTFPMISPSGYAACQDNHVPVVQTLHNYRMICAGALLLREGLPCEKCIGHLPLPALRHRCYRDSVAATGALVAMQVWHRYRRTFSRDVNRYIALTKFAAKKMIDGGLPADRVTVKPNFLPDVPSLGTGARGCAVFVGRLSAEKGVRTMLAAWRGLKHIPLRVIGDGPLRIELEATARAEGLAVEFLGFCDRSQVIAELKDAMMMILPSEWYEGFPMVALEAMACGTPVIAARIGSLDEVVIDGQTGFKFAAKDADDLRQKVVALWGNAALRGEMRERARARSLSLYGADANFTQLSQIYQEVIQERKRLAGIA